MNFVGKTFGVGCFVVVIFFALVRSEAQTIVNRIDTFDEGLFSLGLSGTTTNQDSISSISSDLFDERFAHVNPTGVNPQIAANLDPLVSPSVDVIAQNALFASNYLMLDLSTVDLTANGATGLLISLEEEAVGQELEFIMNADGGASGRFITMDGSGEYYMPFSQFAGMDPTLAEGVGFAIHDFGSSPSTTVVNGYFTAAVPEPGSIVVLATASVFGLMRRRRKCI